MKPLGPPDSHHLSAAVGWLELGNVAEAKADLNRITEENRHHPDALEVGWLIAAEQQDWEEGLRLARALLEAAPGRPNGWLHQAYALRRTASGSLQQARDALLPALEKFPQEPTIPYNLSCYECQMGDLDTARIWLDRAIKAGGIEMVKEMALHDPDLEPLWEDIRGM